MKDWEWIKEESENIKEEKKQQKKRRIEMKNYDKRERQVENPLKMKMNTIRMGLKGYI